MDAEGTNVRRISFEGEWNDDATWSPDGEQIAYTSRVNGRFQIRIANLVTGREPHRRRRRIERAADLVAGRESGSPSSRIAAARWQIYRMRVDGTDIQQLTFDGENKDPDWSKKAGMRNVLCIDRRERS